MNEEMMELEKLEETKNPVDDFEGTCDEGTESEGGHGGLVAIIVGGLATITTAVIIGKKIKNKKANKPKQKVRYKLVKVIEEVPGGEIEEDGSEEDDFEEIELD